MTAVFEQHGLRIQYPENWKLQQNQAQEHALEIQIAAPSGAFWSLLAFRRNLDEDELMQHILNSINEQYESAEWTPTVEMLGRFNAVGYDTFFFCLDLLVSNRMRCIESGQHKLLIMYQAENREFDKMEPVFSAITVSMLSTLEPTNRYEADIADS